LVLLPTYTGRGDALVPIGIVDLGLVLYTVFHPGARLARVTGVPAADLEGTAGGAADGDGPPPRAAAGKAH
jgi:hypothetical protein